MNITRRHHIIALYLFIALTLSLNAAQQRSDVSPQTSDLSETSDVSAQTSDLSLADVLVKVGAAAGQKALFRTDPLFKSGLFEAGRHRVVFETGEKGGEVFALFDDRSILTLPAPYIRDGALFFPASFAASLAQSFGDAVRDDRSHLRIAAIIVDPGHGGKDSGATSVQTIDGVKTNVVEKEITLDVSRLLAARLKTMYPDKQILLTRTGDTYPTLEDRVTIANNVKLEDNEAIVFVSVHANASFNKAARGFEVWYLSPEYRRTVLDKDKLALDVSNEVASIFNAMLEEEYTTESVMMARSIDGRIIENFGAGLPSRGIKAEEWFVVRNARMPSVLVELGFVSNAADARLMLDGAGQKKYAEAISGGIRDFITRFESSGGFTGVGSLTLR